jgi:hypothetical protein
MLTDSRRFAGRGRKLLDTSLSIRKISKILNTAHLKNRQTEGCRTMAAAMIKMK